MNKFDKDIYCTESGKTVEIYFYAHASLSINYDNCFIYVDPVSEYADYKLCEKADIILITHDHYDHFDKQAVKDLQKAETEIIANETTIRQLGQGKILKKHEEIKSCGIKIKAFDAYNTTKGRDKFHPKGRDNSYLISIENIRIYISGDTETIENDEEINNCNILFMAVNQPYTMNLEQMEKYASQVNPIVFYPYHTTDTNMEAVKKIMSKYNFETKIRNMK